MASLKLTIFLMAALIYPMVIRCEDNLEEQKTAELGGLFTDLREKVSYTFERAVEKSKDAFKITEDDVSKYFKNLKEKGKDLIYERPENLE